VDVNKARLRIALLAGCLLLGAGLRLVGLTRGHSDFVLPEQVRQGAQQSFFTFHPDEETLVRAALELDSVLRPPLTAYGTLPMLLARGWLGATDLVVPGDALDLRSPADRPVIFVSVRILAVVLSCLCLWLVWLLGCRHFGPTAGLLAALWLAVAPVAVQQAHFYTVDTLFTLLALTFLWVALQALETGRLRLYLLSGALAGAAAAVRLNGVLLGAVLLAGHFLSHPWGPDESRPAWLWRRLQQRELWLAALAGAGVLLAFEPYLAARPSLMWRVENTDDFAYSVKVASGEILRSWSLVDLHTIPYLHYWTHLWPQAVGWPLTLLLLLGVGYAVRKMGWVRWLLLLWSALYFLGIGGLLTKHVRYLLPVLPFLGLLAADLAQALARRRLGAVVVAGVAAYTLLYGVAFSRIYAAEDSRVLAGRWLAQNVPEGSIIGVESGGFSLQAVVSQERHRQRYIEAGWLFSTRGYLSCQATRQYLREQLRDCSFVAIVDVNRYRQYTAAPELFPGGADFYRRLAQGELGFARVQQFRNRPRLLGWDFGDDQGEPSFLGYDHPAVWVFSRQASFEADWEQWGRELDDCPGCAGPALREVAAGMRSGELGTALSRIEQVLQEHPGLRYAYLIAANIHRLRGRPELGEAALGAYLAGYTDISYGAHLIPWATGLSLVDLGLDDLAQVALGDGLSRKGTIQSPYLGTMAESYIHLASQVRDRGRREPARQAYRMSLQIRPRPEAYNALAAMAAENGDLPEALELWEKSLELDDAQVKAHLSAGRAAGAGGDFARGLYHLGRAVDLDRLLTPQERVADYDNLASEAQARGLLDLAVGLWERSLAVDPDQPGVRMRLQHLRGGRADAGREELDRPNR
jgi:tetratricopeptide (TPR) repeat protein